MKKITLLGAILAFGLIVTSCALGSGNIEVRDMTPANSYTSVDVDGVCALTITEGEICEVVVTADDNIYKYISIRESGDRLYIDLDSQGTVLSNYTFEVEVTMPELNLIDIDGVIDCDIRNFDITNDLRINVDGTNNVNSSISTMTGDLTLNTDGTNSVNLYGLVVSGNGNLNINGVESVKIDISGNISGSISGISRLNYRTGSLSSFNQGGITCEVTRD